jgi:hypothetical protein
VICWMTHRALDPLVTDTTFALAEEEETFETVDQR